MICETYIQDAFTAEATKIDILAIYAAYLNTGKSYSAGRV